MEKNNGIVPFVEKIDDIAMQMTNVADVVNNVTTSVTDTIQQLANVKLEMARLDTELEKFLAETGANLQRFRSLVPVLSKQLDKISDTIDRVTDKVVQHAMDCQMSEDELKRHSILMDSLEKVNNDFNNLLMRILSI